MNDKPVVLFLCIHNSGRSLAAKVLLDHYAAGRVEVRSAGSEPADQLNPSVAAVLQQRGLDTSKEFPKPLTDGDAQAADVVVTMGCGDTCPYYPGKRYLDWDLQDPAGLPVDQVRPIVDEIDRRVQELLAELTPTSQLAHTTPKTDETPGPISGPADKVEIRPYRPADQEDFAQLVTDVLGEYDFTVDPVLEADLEHPEHTYTAIWVATDHAHVIGSVAIRLLDDTHVAELKRMYLTPVYRHRGIGRSLLNQAISWAENHNCRTIVLDTSPAMTEAQQLYEKAGFAQTGTRTETGTRDSRCEILYTLQLTKRVPNNT